MYENTHESNKGNEPKRLAHSIFERKTREIYKPNEYYSFDLVIKTLLGRKHPNPLYFGIPHAVNYASIPNIGSYISNPKVATYLVHNSLGRKEARASSFAGWIDNAEHPFLIFLFLLERDGYFENSSVEQAKLFIPFHNSGNLDKNLMKVYESTAIELREKSNSQNLPHVLLRAEDIKIGRDRPFSRLGFEVKTAGQIFDRKFLFRWVNIISNYQEIESNAIGSHLFYACALNRKVNIWKSTDIDEIDLQSTAVEGKVKINDPEIKLFFQELRSKQNNIRYNEFKLNQVARRIMGENYSSYNFQEWRRKDKIARLRHPTVPLLTVASKFKRRFMTCYSN
jgi:hypothetical protein